MSLTITEIKNILSTTDYDRLPDVLDSFRADERSGVIKLKKTFIPKAISLLPELMRSEEALLQARLLRRRLYCRSAVK